MNAHVKLLLLSTSLQACACFQFLPVIQELSLQPRPMTMRCRQKYSSPGEAYFLPLSRLGPTRLGRSTTFRAEPEGNDGARFGGGEEGESDEDYSADALTTFLGKFLPGKGASDQPQAKDLVFNVGYSAKRRGMSASEMASAVDEGLKRHGWFVTGRVDASLFSDSFFFSDPQVSLTGVDKYAEGVAKLFDQEESRCDVISTEVEEDNVVVRWRLSGRINLPFKPPIKPYVVVTTFERDTEGLLSTQRDEFSIAGWDILLHAVFPGHPFGAEPAPPVKPLGA
ncbi:unnamed protein product [Ascophyllum nodosum]